MTVKLNAMSISLGVITRVRIRPSAALAREFVRDHNIVLRRMIWNGHADFGADGAGSSGCDIVESGNKFWRFMDRD